MDTGAWEQLRPWLTERVEMPVRRVVDTAAGAAHDGRRFLRSSAGPDGASLVARWAAGVEPRHGRWRASAAGGIEQWVGYDPASGIACRPSLLRTLPPPPARGMDTSSQRASPSPRTAKGRSAAHGRRMAPILFAIPR